MARLLFLLMMPYPFPRPVMIKAATTTVVRTSADSKSTVADVDSTPTSNITDIDPWSPSFIIMGHFKNTSVSTETTFLKSNEYQTPKSKY